jgi:hypothetical protein
MNISFVHNSPQKYVAIFSLVATAGGSDGTTLGRPLPVGAGLEVGCIKV